MKMKNSPLITLEILPPALKKQKGFIVAELIVVLLIIVALLAILIPLVTNYIDDAKRDAELSEARSVAVALQTIIVEDETDKNLNEFIKYVDYDNFGLTVNGKKAVEQKLNTKIGRTENIAIDKDNTLTGFTYHTIKGSIIDYNNDNYVVKYTY